MSTQSIASLRRFFRSTSGNVGIMFALTVVPVLGAAGVALDYARHQDYQTQLQAAADAGALAAAGAHGLTREQRRALAESVFRANDRTGLATAVDSGVGNDGSVTVTGSATVRTSVMAALGYDTMGIEVTSRADQGEDGQPVCVLALNESVAGALTVIGTADVVAKKCVLYSNSKDLNGLVVQGAAKTDVAGFCSAGGVKTNKVLTPSPEIGCPVKADPYATLVAPDTSGCKYNNVKVGPKATQALQPGVYCGGLDIQGTATFAKGTYVIKNGSLKVNAKANATGTDLLFYFTGTGAGFDVNGGGTLNLAAATTGTYAGVLFWQDKNASPGADNKINGNSASRLFGALYAPTSSITMNGSSGFGGGSTYMPIVADQVKFAGTTDVKIEATMADTKPLPKTAGGVYLAH